MSEATITEDSGAAVASPEAIEATAPVAAELPLEGGSVSWRNDLAPEIKDHPALTRIPDVPGLAKAFLETKELVGRKGIILPKEGDTADQARFHKEIGVPETVDGYELNFAPPEGLPWSPEFETTMLAKMHGRGIPKQLAGELFHDYAEVQVQQYTAMTEASGQGRETAAAELRTELGADYEPSLALSKRAFAHAAGDHADAIQHLVLADGTHLGDNPLFVRTFMNVGKQYAEAGLAGEKSGMGFVKSPSQAQDEINALYKNPAYFNADDPEHASIMGKMNELFEMAHPEKAPEVL